MAEHSLDLQPWQTVSTRPAFQNRWLQVWLDEVLLPTGQPYEYTRLQGAGIGVGVIGFNTNGEILLEREYRHGVHQVVWQVPGGLAKANEDLQLTGLRELEEETGYAPVAITPESVRYLGMIWDNPGYSPMCSHLYAVWNLAPTGKAQRDPAEFVTLHWVKPTWLKEAIRSGEIKDRVVVAAVAYLLLNEWLK